LATISTSRGYSPGNGSILTSSTHTVPGAMTFNSKQMLL